MPEIDGSDPVRLHPSIDGALQAFQLADRGELGVNVPPMEHRGPKVGCIRRRKDYRARGVLGRAGHRVGARLIQPDLGGSTTNPQPHTGGRSLACGPRVGGG